MRIVETSNSDEDFQYENFVTTMRMSELNARLVCITINHVLSGEGAPRHCKVVENGYELKDGFEP